MSAVGRKRISVEDRGTMNSCPIRAVTRAISTARCFHPGSPLALFPMIPFCQISLPCPSLQNVTRLGSLGFRVRWIELKSMGIRYYYK